MPSPRSVFVLWWYMEFLTHNQVSVTTATSISWDSTKWKKKSVILLFRERLFQFSTLMILWLDIVDVFQCKFGQNWKLCCFRLAIWQPCKELTCEHHKLLHKEKIMLLMFFPCYRGLTIRSHTCVGVDTKNVFTRLVVTYRFGIVQFWSFGPQWLNFPLKLLQIQQACWTPFEVGGVILTAVCTFNFVFRHWSIVCFFRDLAFFSFGGVLRTWHIPLAGCSFA